MALIRPILLYWRFTDADRRAALAPRVEGILREGLAHAPTSGLKNAWFRSLARVALTGQTLDFVAAVWRQERVIEGLELGEPDYIALAQELALRNVPGRETILDGQLARIENPDRRARFTFVRPALSADAAVRDTFFASLTDLANRQREAWVLEALEYLHHPLRAAHAERYVRPSLDLLETIQRTGDIFFPKRGWTRRSAVTPAPPWQTRCAPSWPSAPTTRRACGASSCSRPTSCSEPPADTAQCWGLDGSLTPS